MGFLKCSEGFIPKFGMKNIENIKFRPCKWVWIWKYAHGYVVTEMKSVDLQQWRSMVGNNFTKVRWLV